MSQGCHLRVGSRLDARTPGTSFLEYERPLVLALFTNILEGKKDE